MSFRRFDSIFTTDETNTLLDEVASQLLDQLHDSEIAGRFKVALEKGDYLSICDYAPDYACLDSESAWVLRQVQAFYSKRQDLNLGSDPDLAAIQKFMEAEQLCAESNDVFMKWRQGGFFFPRDVDTVLYRASQKNRSYSWRRSKDLGTANAFRSGRNHER